MVEQLFYTEKVIGSIPIMPKTKMLHFINYLYFSLGLILIFAILFLLFLFFDKLKYLKIAIFYLLFFWILLFCFLYYYPKELLFIFVKNLVFCQKLNFLLVDKQVWVNLLIDFSLFYSLFFIVFILGIYAYLLAQSFLYKHEKNVFYYFFLTFVLYFFISFWIVDQDLGFFLWQSFEKEDNLFFFFDYKPSLELIFLFFEIEFYDLFILNLCVLVLYLIFYIENINFNNIVKKFRIVIFLFCYLIVFYILGGEGFYKDIYLLFSTFFCLEISFIVIFFFRGLKRKKI